MNTPNRAAKAAPLLLLIALTAGCANNPPRYLMGAYRFQDGRLISVRASEEKTLRYRSFHDGESRRLYRHRRLRYVSGEGFSRRAPVKLVVDFIVGEDGEATGLSWRFHDAAPETATRIARALRSHFPSGDVSLFARLDLPDGKGPFPAIVLIGGSGESACTDHLSAGDFLATNGIAALTYDKRGTGRSGGDFTSDFHVLAKDAVAAVEHLKARSDIDSTRIGLCGFSQGGWVAPLAASMSPNVSYVIVNYGMMESPAEEALMETLDLARERGADERSLVEIERLTVAAIDVIASDFKEWEEFEKLKKEYKKAEWREKIEGTPVEDMLKYPKFLAKLIGPVRAPEGLDWYYDSTDVLRSLEIPMVWLLAEMDESAPNRKTIPKLRKMIARGKPYELIVFPGADHSMLVFREGERGRVYTGYASDYFTTLVDRARRLSGLTETK